MRLFIAINFSGATRAKLISLRDELRSFSSKGNFSLTENLHMTLEFLGECDAKQTAAAKQAVSGVSFEPFNITIAGGGYFDKARPNLVFCGLQNTGGYNRLLQLHTELTDNLSAKGFALEKRKFWPHITLGREVVWKDTGGIRFPVIDETVASIELMKSERTGGILTYTAIQSNR